MSLDVDVQEVAKIEKDESVVVEGDGGVVMIQEDGDVGPVKQADGHQVVQDGGKVGQLRNSRVDDGKSGRIIGLDVHLDVLGPPAGLFERRGVEARVGGFFP